MTGLNCVVSARWRRQPQPRNELHEVTGEPDYTVRDPSYTRWYETRRGPRSEPGLTFAVLMPVVKVYAGD